MHRPFYFSDSPIIKQLASLGSTQLVATMPIWLNHLQCTGNETAIDQCIHDRWGNNHCTHTQDVVIQCRGE